MPIFNFEKQFAPLVSSGVKRQTIRKEMKFEIRPGARLFLYSGLRTKYARNLINPSTPNAIKSETTGSYYVECRSVEKIEMSDGLVYLDGVRLLDGSKARQIANRDGFNNFGELAVYIERMYGLPFNGVIIGW